MMINLLRQRRSIRKYKSDKLAPEVLGELKEALLRSPSSRDIKPWEFIFVTDPAVNQKLAVSKPHGASFLKNAPLGVVICGDENSSDVWIEDCAIAAITLQYAAEARGLGACWIQIRNRMYSDLVTSEEHIRKTRLLWMNKVNIQWF
jgi:nitroreductase